MQPTAPSWGIMIRIVYDNLCNILRGVCRGMLTSFRVLVGGTRVDTCEVTWKYEPPTVNRSMFGRLQENCMLINDFISDRNNLQILTLHTSDGFTKAVTSLNIWASEKKGVEMRRIRARKTRKYAPYGRFRCTKSVHPWESHQRKRPAMQSRVNTGLLITGPDVFCKPYKVEIWICNLLPVIQFICIRCQRELQSSRTQHAATPRGIGCILFLSDPRIFHASTLLTHTSRTVEPRNKPARGRRCDNAYLTCARRHFLDANFLKVNMEYVYTFHAEFDTSPDAMCSFFQNSLRFENSST